MRLSIVGVMSTKPWWHLKRKKWSKLGADGCVGNFELAGSNGGYDGMIALEEGQLVRTCEIIGTTYHSAIPLVFRDDQTIA